MLTAPEQTDVRFMLTGCSSSASPSPLRGEGRDGGACRPHQDGHWRRYSLGRFIRKPSAPTPTQPSPLEGEGFWVRCAMAAAVILLASPMANAAGYEEQPVTHGPFQPEVKDRVRS